MSKKKTPTKQTVLDIFNLYKQGAAIKDILKAKKFPADSLDAFFGWIDKYELSQEWQTTKEIRKHTVQANQDIATGLIGGKPQALSVSVIPVDEENQALLAQIEQEKFSETTKIIVYRVASALTLYKTTQLTIEQCIEKVTGLNYHQYAYAVRNYPVLHEAQQNAIQHRKAVLVDMYQFKKLTLLNQLMDSMIEQTVDFETKEESIKINTDTIYNRKGDEIGTKSTKVEGMKMKTNKPSPQMIRIAADIMGINPEEEALIPEAAVKLTTITPAQLQKENDKLAEEYEKFLKQNPDYKE